MLRNKFSLKSLMSFTVCIEVINGSSMLYRIQMSLLSLFQEESCFFDDNNDDSSDFSIFSRLGLSKCKNLLKINIITDISRVNHSETKQDSRRKIKEWGIWKNLPLPWRQNYRLYPFISVRNLTSL